MIFILKGLYLEIGKYYSNAKKVKVVLRVDINSFPVPGELCGSNCIIQKALEMQGCSRWLFFIMVAVGQSILWRHMTRLSM